MSQEKGQERQQDAAGSTLTQRRWESPSCGNDKYCSSKEDTFVAKSTQAERRPTRKKLYQNENQD